MDAEDESGMAVPSDADPIRLYKRYFRTNLKFLYLEMKDKGEEV